MSNLKVYFEDEWIIAVEKPAKLFVHPMPGEKDSKNCLLFQVRDHVGKHVYAINRLDRPVSGIVIFAKDATIVSAFQTIWHAQTTIKKYLCLHRGKIHLPGKFDSELSKQGVFKQESKKELKQVALTFYSPIQYFPQEFCTYTEVEIKTGRYHQIRRHFRKAIMPLIGDRKHGKGVVNQHFQQKYELDRLFLHCTKLAFTHPLSQQYIELNSKLPSELSAVLNSMRLNQ